MLSMAFTECLIFELPYIIYEIPSAVIRGRGDIISQLLLSDENQSYSLVRPSSLAYFAFDSFSAFSNSALARSGKVRVRAE